MGYSLHAFRARCAAVIRRYSPRCARARHTDAQASKSRWSSGAHANDPHEPPRGAGPNAAGGVTRMRPCAPRALATRSLRLEWSSTAGSPLLRNRLAGDRQVLSSSTYLPQPGRARATCGRYCDLALDLRPARASSELTSWRCGNWRCSVPTVVAIGVPALGDVRQALMPGRPSRCGDSRARFSSHVGGSVEQTQRSAGALDRRKRPRPARAGFVRKRGDERGRRQCALALSGSSRRAAAVRELEVGILIRAARALHKLRERKGWESRGRYSTRLRRRRRLEIFLIHHL